MKMMLISTWVKNPDELKFMGKHMGKKGVKCEIRRNMRTGMYGFYREYKAVGKDKPPEPFPDRKAWENR